MAVREASEALSVHWKGKLNRHDVDDTVFWQQTLSAGDPTSGRPKLAWPGTVTDKTIKSMRGGLEPLASALNALATGLNLTVRNVTTHTRTELTEQEGDGATRGLQLPGPPAGPLRDPHRRHHRWWEIRMVRISVSPDGRGELIEPARDALASGRLRRCDCVSAMERCVGVTRLRVAG